METRLARFLCMTSNRQNNKADLGFHTTATRIQGEGNSRSQMMDGQSGNEPRPTTRFENAPAIIYYVMHIHEYCLCATSECIVTCLGRASCKPSTEAVEPEHDRDG